MRWQQNFLFILLQAAGNSWKSINIFLEYFQILIFENKMTKRESQFRENISQSLYLTLFQIII